LAVGNYSAAAAVFVGNDLNVPVMGDFSRKTLLSAHEQGNNCEETEQLETGMLGHFGLFSSEVCNAAG
jgi:hypothetical protein